MAAMTTTKQRGVVHRIIAAAAEQLAQHPSIPAENRDAFRLTAISVFEQQISDIIGCDTIQLTGWTIAPSERQARRDRIVAALRSGDQPAHIASRELVSVRWVEKLRRIESERTVTP
jgi:hypothetical protein